jgi:hypothetical protein
MRPSSPERRDHAATGTREEEDGPVTGRRVLLIAAALLVGAAGLAGCAEETPAPAPTSGSPTATSASPSPTPTPTTASPTPSPTPSPSLTGFATAPVTGGTPVTAGEPVGISRVAVGRQDGYDRFVVQLDAPSLPPYEVTPQDSPVFVLDPRGDEVRLQGERGVLAVLRDIDVLRIPLDVDRTPGYPALREVRLTGAFEGVVAYGLGVDGSGAVRVTTLRSPTRLVIDVLHP